MNSNPQEAAPEVQPHNLTRLAIQIVRDIEDALAAQQSQGLPPMLDEADEMFRRLDELHDRGHATHCGCTLCLRATGGAL